MYGVRVRNKAFYLVQGLTRKVSQLQNCVEIGIDRASIIINAIPGCNGSCLLLNRRMDLQSANDGNHHFDSKSITVSCYTAF